MKDVFGFIQGNTPLLISAPHAGHYIPDDIKAKMNPIGVDSTDTDWHVEKLYDFASTMGASLLWSTHSRYVIDLNRPENDQNLYPGQDTTGLIPLDSFAKDKLYTDFKLEPNNTEITDRIEKYWRPYHHKLEETLTSLKDQFGYALLWEAHSIRSEVPRFFEGHLPDMNLGTVNGQSCAPELESRLVATLKDHKNFSHSVNGRFKGGHITRTYGQPRNNIHAVQMEQSQITYMDENPPFTLLDEKVQKVSPLLKDLIQTMLEFHPTT